MKWVWSVRSCGFPRPKPPKNPGVPPEPSAKGFVPQEGEVALRQPPDVSRIGEKTVLAVGDYVGHSARPVGDDGQPRRHRLDVDDSEGL